MSSFLALPLELIIVIISVAAVKQRDGNLDTELLARSSLACKTFYRVTRELQFDTVIRILDAKDAKITPEIVTYQHQDPSLPPLINYVRKLHLTFDIAQHALNEGYVDYLDAFLAPFSGDACRIREFTFTAKKDQSETRVIHPTALFWHNLPPYTQQKFAKILRSSSLKLLDIYGILSLPLRILQSITPNLTSLTLAVTTVPVEPEDLDPPPGRTPPPLLALEMLEIGGLEFELVQPPNALSIDTDETDEADVDNSSVALHVGLSHLIDLPRLQGFTASQAPRGVHITGPPPPLKEIFALCSNLETLNIKFLRADDLSNLHLDKLPSSVRQIDLQSLNALPFVSGRNAGDPGTLARFWGHHAGLPTNIASSSFPKHPLSEVKFYQPLDVQQDATAQIEKLVLRNGTTSYWDALVENLMTIPASTIYLEISIRLGGRGLSSIPDGARPDEKIEADMNRVFEEYNSKYPNKPIILEYHCSLATK